MESPRELLKQARSRFTQKQIAAHLGVNARTIKRWEARENDPPKFAAPALQQLLLPIDNPDNSAGEFSFIDLFAGIGGIRLGFEAAGGRCVFTSEWNEPSVKTYQANFPDTHPIIGDITKVKASEIPDHDVLLAGFPCQPFSIAGVSKKNSLGREHGFRCETQGTLFFDVERIIEEKQPKAFLLENVKHLLNHDKGRTFEVILRALRDKLGYEVHYKVIDARYFVPQHRERIIIVGFREKTGFSWNDLQLPDISKRAPVMKDILHPENGSEEPEGHYTVGKKALVNEDKYVLSTKLWRYLKNYAKKHQAAGNGFGFGLVGPDDVARTLSARYYKDGSEILISRGRKNPRRLTPRECARLMGFDRNGRKFVIPVSDTQAYKQFGNSVVVPVIETVAKIMRPHILSLVDAERSGVRQLPIAV
ncbi:DNA-cytosine methyltransferase [Sulfuricaulis limicola]|uniref:Cytosine-specific methyltransferase n=1 Tax=Sulfuricaulis limicola TaxID=1620215 RepID=A0A1B4XIZ8_9GAMM|nr:DNA (cytosine-5-)-methyltransferase [Sulfuricaulis limicola]BAV34771.1 DNA-cytosine methyltransferase [Sulfuricaulis limicola]